MAKFFSKISSNSNSKFGLIFLMFPIAEKKRKYIFAEPFENSISQGV